MSRQGRTLLIVAGMSVIAVIALSSMAQRYGKILESGAGGTRAVAADPRARAARQVDGFIDVRKAMAKAIEGHGGTPTVVILRAARDQALVESHLDLREYREVRESYRAWVGGSSVSERARADLVEAFEARREELAAADLASYERWDS